MYVCAKHDSVSDFLFVHCSDLDIRPFRKVGSESTSAGTKKEKRDHSRDISTVWSTLRSPGNQWGSRVIQKTASLSVKR